MERIRISCFEGVLSMITSIQRHFGTKWKNWRAGMCLELVCEGCNVNHVKANFTTFGDFGKVVVIGYIDILFEGSLCEKLLF